MALLMLISTRLLTILYIRVSRVAALLSSKLFHPKLLTMVVTLHGFPLVIPCD